MSFEDIFRSHAVTFFFFLLNILICTIRNIGLSLLFVFPQIQKQRVVGAPKVRNEPPQDKSTVKVCYDALMVAAGSTVKTALREKGVAPVRHSIHVRKLDA